jgi:HlyD family secretion protein
MDVREVQKNLEKSLRDYSSTRNDFDEMTKVTYGSGAVPSYTMNDTIKRILEKNQWDLDKAVLDVELKSLALEYSRLSTPIAGIVTHVDTPVAGVNITPATAVFSVSDPSSMVFEANVDETEVGSLSVGQEATITLDAYPEATFSGTISYISYTSQLSSGGATVFPVKISFATPQSIRIGLNGDVSITTNRIPHALVIPIAAMREDKGKKYVYRKVGTKYERAYITVGPSSDTDIVVTGGLADGDTVVTKGFSVIPTPTP